jgi:DNA polymerase I-like protein with 3'-5' exonuclease and polymerase domains
MTTILIKEQSGAGTSVPALSSVETLPFAEVWTCDFEFDEPDGELPVPICMVALEIRSGREIRMWRDDFGSHAPFRTDARSLFVAYAVDAELKCFHQLGWSMPERILDLHVEFRARTSGMINQRHGLLDALMFFGLPHITSEQKTAGRALSGKGSWSESEKRALLDYCATDVVALGPLLAKILPRIRSNRRGLGWALLRGRYMPAVAAMEINGIPIDVPTLTAIRTHKEIIKADLVREIEADHRFDVYLDTTFKLDRFEALLDRHGIDWPRTEKTGQLSLEERVFRAGCEAYPWLHPLRELRDFLEKLKLEDLYVGQDGRNRAALMPFASKTGRNQPSNARFIFAPSKWIRHLIKPEPGMALAYIDWSLQEWNISAVLSGDTEMLKVLETGDMYLEFASMAGWCPPDANKADHEEARDRAKPCVLALGYGMGADSLALKMGTSRQHAADTLQAYAWRFPTYWAWAEYQAEQGDLHRRMRSLFGWPLYVYDGYRANTLRNFPCQANASEMMRLAACLMTEQGLIVCAPVHDAFLLEAPINDLETVVQATQAAMAEASRIVLDGFEVKTDVKITRWPDRYTDKRGSALWLKINELLERHGAI